MAPQPNAQDWSADPSLNYHPPLDVTKTAVVVVDMVNWQVPRAVVAGSPATPYFVESLATTVIPNIAKLLARCRALGVRILFLRIGSSQRDYSDGVAPIRELLREVDGRDGAPACDVVSELSPVEGDISLLKLGSGGFATSGLDNHLRNMGIEHVIYTGVVTNGCVLLTVGGGFDFGYHGYVISDATTTQTPELQDAALKIMEVYMASVVTTDEMIDLLNAASRPGNTPR